MARPLREQVAGGIYHVFARGNNRERIFHDDRDRELYLSMLARVVRREGWRLLGFCLMENHVHLLIETPEPNLAHGMQRLHGGYAQRFNRAHGRVGHVFQGRYGAKRMRNDVQLWVTARYLARNPVRAGLCRQPNRWRWGSHRIVERHLKLGWLDVDRLLEFFSSLGGNPLDRYLAFVAIE